MTAHRIELATSSRARCGCCGASIAKGSLRFAEVVTTQHPGVSRAAPQVQTRFHHLECAADKLPRRLQPALVAAGGLDELTAARREELAARIERALSAPLVAAPSADRERPQVDDLLALAEAQPDDVGPFVVLGDLLQVTGDPRGELIALQLAKERETGAGWEALERRTKEHLERYARELVPSVGTARLIWKRGFVHRVEVERGMTLLAGTIEQWARHPSLRLLRELAVTTDDEVAGNLRPLPASLHKLELRASYAGSSLGPVSELIASAPNLRSLVIAGTTDVERLRHPKLAELAITTLGLTTIAEPVLDLRARLAQLTTDALPSVKRLTIHIPPEYGDEDALDDACRGLAASSLLGALTHLELSGRLGPEGASAVARARAGLPKLDVLRVPLPREQRAVLQPICRALLESTSDRPMPALRTPSADKGPQERRVRNRYKPGWGVGRIVAEHDDRIEVEFEGAGLRVIRSPELLEDVVD